MCAQSVATLDWLSAGRMHLGLGVSGPQVSEGWHGVRFSKPLARTREYVEVVRQILARDKPLSYRGQLIELPLARSRGKSLKLIMRPERNAVPVYLASIGPASLELCGEIADGWLPIWLAPEHFDLLHQHVAAGAHLAERDPGRIDIVAANVPLAVCNDVRRAHDEV
ncbi:MAG: LLM class flavin-dependent oxidoreductase, partial [Parahaliea sp.]